MSMSEIVLILLKLFICVISTSLDLCGVFIPRVLLFDSAGGSGNLSNLALSRCLDMLGNCNPEIDSLAEEGDQIPNSGA